MSRAPGTDVVSLGSAARKTLQALTTELQPNSDFYQKKSFALLLDRAQKISEVVDNLREFENDLYGRDHNLGIEVIIRRGAQIENAKKQGSKIVRPSLNVDDDEDELY